MSAPQPVPAVSLGLPVYNGERYLDQTIRSVMAQTCADFELVISDNGSSDRTEEICRQWAERDPRVVYSRSETNRGAAWNYNRVFELSRAPLFKWIAYDDPIDPRYLEACLDAFARVDDDVVLVFTGTRFIGEHDEPVSLKEEDLELLQDSPASRLSTAITRMTFCNPVFGVIRRDVLATTNLIVAYDSSDMLLLGELAMRGKFHRVDEVLFNRRWHPAMSVAVTTTQADRAAWFDPDARLARRRRRRVGDLIHTKELRLLPRHLHNVRTAPIGTADRLRCACGAVAVTPRTWVRRGVRAHRRRRAGS